MSELENEMNEEASFLPEAEAENENIETLEKEVSVEGTELDAYDSASIEELEFIEDERIQSIVESILFASDRPVSLASIKQVFKGTQVKNDKLRRVLDNLAIEYAGGTRGITLEEVPGGYQLRTKVDNMDFLRRTLKTRTFKLSGPAMEVLSIVAYKQPVIKSELDSIRGVESGHLLRALMEKGLVNFAGKSDLPGRPMNYETTRKFLEIFGLRSIKELPSLSQIDELLPEGIGEEEDEKKERLSDITDSLSQTVTKSYSEGEEELVKIQDQLTAITTSSDFFEQEKLRQKEKRDLEKAQNIREALALGENVPTRDVNWLKKYDDAIAAGTTLAAQQLSTTNISDGKAVANDNIQALGNEVQTGQSLDSSDDEGVGTDEGELFDSEAGELDEYVAEDIDGDDEENSNP